jgi:tetratricopeptide (TPR) repeat protein
MSWQEQQLHVGKAEDIDDRQRQGSDLSQGMKALVDPSKPKSFKTWSILESTARGEAIRYNQDLEEDEQTESLLLELDPTELRNFTILYEGERDNDNPNGNVGNLKLLSRAFYHLFLKTGAVDDLQKSIQKAEEAMTATHIDNADYVLLLKNLIILLGKKYERTRLLEDLEQAILQAEVMFTVTQDSHPIRLPRLLSLVYLKRMRSGHTRSPGDLNEVQATATKAMSAMGALEGVPLSTFEEAIDPAVLAGAIGDRACLLNSQSLAFLRKFDQTGNLAVLDVAITKAREALDASPSSHPHRAWTLSNLGVCLHLRFEQTGVLDDLHMAINAGQESVDILPSGDRKRASMLADLSVSLRRRFDRIGDMDDLDKAISSGEEAIVLMPHVYPYRESAQTILSTSLMRRFERTGDLGDLDLAINKAQEVVAAMNDGHGDTGQALANLAIYLRYRFEQTGDLDELNRAISTGQEAVAATSPSHSDKAVRLSILGGSFFRRFELTGSLDDLNQAIDRGEQAVAISQVKGESAMLNDLGIYLKYRFEQIFDLDDINRAIEVGRRAVTTTPENHPDLAGYFNNLGLRLESRYQRTGELEDLHEAIELGRHAIAMTPGNHPDLAGYFNNLGLRLESRYQRTAELEDLHEAIRLGRHAIAATPETHPDLAGYLNNLADRYKRTGELENLQEAITLFQQALGHFTGQPLIRITAGTKAARILAHQEKWHEAAQALQQVLELLPKVTLQSNSRDDLQHAFRTLSGLASFTASIFLKAGKSATEALQVLEMGRGVIASLLIDSRSDESHLKAEHPALWSEYNQLREEVAISSSPEFSRREDLHSQVVAEVSQAARSSRRYKLFKKIEDMEVEIQNQPGFERFHLAPTEKEILDLACHGPLVSFNTSDVSSQAFLVTKDHVQVVDLPALKVTDVNICVDLLTSWGNINRSDGSLVQDVGDEKPGNQPTDSETMVQLQSLWNNAVKPVLDKLGLRKEERPAGTLPSVWWIGGGLMALLPIHAAGDHSTGSRENTLSHVVSSYIPTLKSLQFARSKTWRSLKEQGHNILIVSMPTTPGFKSRLNVGEEVEAIRDEFGSHGLVTALERPSKADVLDKLSSCSVAHFACHGVADPVEPAKSSLLLGSMAREELTVSDLDSVKHDLAQIAYLSACSIAEVKVHNLLDESIHLASTFQLMGFQHVIGTLWGADDGAAVQVAGQFYKHLLQDEEDGSMSVAYALHNAILIFRNTGSNSTEVSKWAPFIHIGS